MSLHMLPPGNPSPHPMILSSNMPKLHNNCGLPDCSFSVLTLELWTFAHSIVTLHNLEGRQNNSSNITHTITISQKPSSLTMMLKQKHTMIDWTHNYKSTALLLLRELLISQDVTQRKKSLDALVGKLAKLTTN